MNRTLFRYPTVADVRKSDADVTLALAPTQQQKAFRVFHELNSTSIAATVSGVDVCLDIKAYSTTAGSAVNAWPCGQRGVKDNEFCKVLFHRHLVRLMPLTTRFVRRHAIPPAFSSSDGLPLTGGGHPTNGRCEGCSTSSTSTTTTSTSTSLLWWRLVAFYRTFQFMLTCARAISMLTPQGPSKRAPLPRCSQARRSASLLQ